MKRALTAVTDFFKGLIRGKEPVVATAAVGALAAVALKMGLTLDPTIENAGVILVAAILTGFARQKVTPYPPKDD